MLYFVARALWNHGVGGLAIALGIKTSFENRWVAINFY